jgi:hypothetical protein
LPDSDDEDKEMMGWGRKKNCTIPAPLGQYQSPAVSKNPKARQKAGEPTYAQPTCTSTRKKQLADIDRQIAAGEGSADGRVAGKKGKKRVGAAELIDELAYLGTDCAFIADLTPIVAEAIG